MRTKAHCRHYPLGVCCQCGLTGCGRFCGAKKKKPCPAAVGFDLHAELKALRHEEAKRLSKAEHAFSKVDAAMQAVILRVARKVVGS